MKRNGVKGNETGWRRMEGNEMEWKEIRWSIVLWIEMKLGGVECSGVEGN